MVKRAQKKKINKMRTAFILFCITAPILQFFIFYIYTNFSSILMAFTNSRGEWSFENFIRFGNELIDKNSEISIAIKNTFITFGIMLVAYPFKVLVSYFIYKKVPGYNIYRILFFLPSIIFGVAVAMIFTRMIGVNGFVAEWVGNMLGLDETPELLADSRFANFTIWAQMLWLGFPGDLIIWGGTFARIPEEVLESASLDGVTWWQEFTHIIVPLVWPTVSLQMVLMFCGIFSASGNVWLLTRGQYGTHTLSSWMYEMLYANSGGSYSSNVYNYLSAVGLILTVIAVAISMVIRKWTDRAFNDVEF